MKIFFRNIHLYLGLAAGIVISITCFTGAVLVFEKELQSWIYPERYYVEPQGNRLPVDVLAANLQREIPNAKITAAKVYPNEARSVELTYQVQEKKKRPSDKEEQKGGKGGGGESNQAFMNPYTGELISLYSYRKTFFFTMFSLHRWLLAGDTGKIIVGISTSIFLFILITGIVLWWPKNIKKLKQRVKLKLDAGWKRVNHDLHISIGFYTAIFLFLFAFTGLAWSFKWFNDAIYWVTGTENKRPEPPASTYVANAKTISFEDALKVVQQEVKDVQYYNLNMPGDSAGAVSVTVLSSDPQHEKASDQYFLDQYTGAMIGTALYRDRNLGQRVRSTFYPVHVGSIGGIVGRIIALLSCVAGFTFPITGTIMWLNRLKKERAKNSKSKQVKKKSPSLSPSPTISTNN
jgi:uncharacterized iron-regulated membrane protein